jgi:peptidoglycan/xylan/chitin deacetylase (PgdA/CDA1 family)
MMSVVFTCSIDDGHPSDMRMAELLHKHGLNGTFFIPVKNAEGHPVMKPAEIRSIAERFEIGSHTHDHCFLSSVDLAESHYQIAEGKRQLEDILGKKVSGFCYPGGKFRPADAAIVQSSGFSYARTTVNLCFDAGDNPFEMPTTVQFYPHSRNVYLRNFAKSGRWSQRRNGLRLAMQHENWLKRMYALFDYAALNDRLFHVWCHSKDIDDLGAWRHVDRFYAHVATRVACQDRIDNHELAARHF